MEKYYAVSSLGKIKSLERYRIGRIPKTFALVKERILKLSKNRDGYLHAVGSINSKKVHLYAHKYVAMMFIENKGNKKTVNHIDGNKNNNSITNLEWCTQSENISHAYAVGLR